MVVSSTVRPASQVVHRKHLLRFCHESTVRLSPINLRPRRFSPLDGHGLRKVAHRCGKKEELRGADGEGLLTEMNNQARHRNWGQCRARRFNVTPYAGPKFGSRRIGKQNSSIPEIPPYPQMPSALSLATQVAWEVNSQLVHSSGHGRPRRSWTIRCPIERTSLYSDLASKSVSQAPHKKIVLHKRLPTSVQQIVTSIIGSGSPPLLGVIPCNVRKFRGGQSLLLRPKAVASACGEHSSVYTVRAGLRRWQGKMEWRRRDGEVEQRAMAGNGFVSDGDKENQSTSSQDVTSRVEDADAFCIIEGRDTVLDFSQMQLQEIRDNVTSRRNKIFLLMEEVRRLRIQLRIKSQEQGVDVKDPSLENEEMPEYPSSIPFLPPLTSATLKQYYATCLALVAIIILFGGLVAPVLELKLGMGGTSYEDFIRQMHLPLQLSEVDPIVASFSGGAVGVISSLMVVEINNVKQQEHKRCRYCHGTGYLACARCSGSGSLIVAEPVASVGFDDRPLQEPTTQRCPNCSGAAKVMCPTCLCTGMALASEHDPRIDPFV